MTRQSSNPFDELLGTAGPEERAPRRPARGWLVASIASAAAGAALVAGSAFAAAGPGVPENRAAPASAVGASAEATPHSAPTAADREPGERITDLVDDQESVLLADRTGIPLRALRAYLGASLRVAAENPDCGLGWNTLAGIGSVESDHGTFRTSVIGEDGLTTPPIIGIALDGRDSAVIRDTDDGALDGDAVWDRAVGPMQFIPATWAEWGADGNDDGVADPQHIDDSALAAGRYLCASGGDLTDPSGWIAAVAAYNDATDYNNRVAAAATSYADIAH